MVCILIYNTILIHVIYSLPTKAKGFIQSVIQLGQRCSYVGKLFEVYGANYLYVPWYKPVVYDNFDEQM